MNCNSITGKVAEFANLTEYTDPDVIMMTETKLDSSINAAEFLPEGYQVGARKDRNRSGGGVMLAFKSCYNVETIELNDVEAETLWASVSTTDNKKIVTGVFYRQPGRNTDQVEQLEKAVDQVTSKFQNNSNITYMLGGDFNAGDVDWDSGTVRPNSPNKEANERSNKKSIP